MKATTTADFLASPDAEELTAKLTAAEKPAEASRFGKSVVLASGSYGIVSLALHAEKPRPQLDSRPKSRKSDTPTMA